MRIPSWLAAVIVIGAIALLMWRANSFPQRGGPYVERSAAPDMAARAGHDLATMHQGAPLPPDAPLAAEFRRIVDAVATKRDAQPEQVRDLILVTNERLQRRGVHANVLTTAIDLEREWLERPDSDLFEVTAAYVERRTLESREARALNDQPSSSSTPTDSASSHAAR